MSYPLFKNNVTERIPRRKDPTVCWHHQNCNYDDCRLNLQTQQKPKEVQKCIKMQYFPVFLNMTLQILVKKGWRQQNSRIVPRSSYIFLDLLWMMYNCTKFHHCELYATDFLVEGLLAPPPHTGCESKPKKLQNATKSLLK